MVMKSIEIQAKPNRKESSISQVERMLVIEEMQKWEHFKEFPKWRKKNPTSASAIQDMYCNSGGMERKW